MANDDQWDPSVFVIRDAGTTEMSTQTHIRGIYGDCGENEGVLSVAAVINQSPSYPDAGRIIVGTPVKSPLIDGNLPDLGGFSCSVEAMRRFIKVASRACDDVETAMKAGK